MLNQRDRIVRVLVKKVLVTVFGKCFILGCLCSVDMDVREWGGTVRVLKVRVLRC